MPLGLEAAVQNAINSHPLHFLYCSAPTAPPRNVKFKSVTSSSIQITWLPPDPEKQNGVIAMYEVEVYQETSGMKLEIITRSLMHADTTIWKISKLGPRTEYVFHVRAGTAGGYGPAVVVHKRSEGNPLAKLITDFFSEPSALVESSSLYRKSRGSRGYSRFLPQGKLTGAWVKLTLCGDPVLVAN